MANSVRKHAGNAGAGGWQIILTCVIALAPPNAFAFQSHRAPQSAIQSQVMSETRGIILDRDIVNLSVTVLDRSGRFVSGLDASHFEVFDNQVRQSIAFFSHEDVPVSIGFVYDVSGSMEAAAKRAFLALDRFLDHCHGEDDLFLVGFNSRPHLTCDFTTRSPALSNSLLLIESDGRTAFFDAAYYALDKIRQGKHGKRALVIISDGQDNASRYTMREVREVLKEADVMVYALGIADMYGDPFEIDRGFAALEELARITGGQAFFPTNEIELVDQCVRVALELRHQYSIGFYPSTKDQTGQWHKLKVRVAPPPGLPRLAVRTREGYFGSRSVPSDR